MFNDLPPEIHLRTCTFLTRQDLRSLSRSSRYFFSLVSRDLLIADLQHHRSSETIFCLLKYPLGPAPPVLTPTTNIQTTYFYTKRSRALQIEHNPGPFIIRDVEIGSSSDGTSHAPIRLHIYRPVFWRPDADKRPLDLRIDLTAVSLVHREPEIPSGGSIATGLEAFSAGAEEDGDIGLNHDGDLAGGGTEKSAGAFNIERMEEWQRRNIARDATIDYSKDTCARGRFALLTARMLRASYICPECRGQRFIKRPSAHDMPPLFHVRYMALISCIYSSSVSPSLHSIFTHFYPRDIRAPVVLQPTVFLFLLNQSVALT